MNASSIFGPYDTNYEVTYSEKPCEITGYYYNWSEQFDNLDDAQKFAESNWQATIRMYYYSKDLAHRTFEQVEWNEQEWMTEKDSHGICCPIQSLADYLEKMTKGR